MMGAGAERVPGWSGGRMPGAVGLPRGWVAEGRVALGALLWRGTRGGRRAGSLRRPVHGGRKARALRGPLARAARVVRRCAGGDVAQGLRPVEGGLSVALHVGWAVAGMGCPARARGPPSENTRFPPGPVRENCGSGRGLRCRTRVRSARDGKGWRRRQGRSPCGRPCQGRPRCPALIGPRPAGPWDGNLKVGGGVRPAGTCPWPGTLPWRR